MKNLCPDERACERLLSFEANPNNALGAARCTSIAVEAFRTTNNHCSLLSAPEIEFLTESETKTWAKNSELRLVKLLQHEH